MSCTLESCRLRKRGQQEEDERVRREEDERGIRVPNLVFWRFYLT